MAVLMVRGSGDYIYFDRTEWLLQIAMHTKSYYKFLLELNSRFYITSTVNNGFLVPLLECIHVETDRTTP